MQIYVYLWNTGFISFGQIPSHGIVGSLNSSFEEKEIVLNKDFAIMSYDYPCHKPVSCKCIDLYLYSLISNMFYYLFFDSRATLIWFFQVYSTFKFKKWNASSNFVFSTHNLSIIFCKQLQVFQCFSISTKYNQYFDKNVFKTLLIIVIFLYTHVGYHYAFLILSIPFIEFQF